MKFYFLIILMFSVCISEQLFSQPPICSPNVQQSSGSIIYNGSSMFSPAASPFWNQGGSGIPGLVSYNICRESGSVTISATNLPAGHSVAWFIDDTPSGFATWPTLPPIYLGTGTSWTEPVPAYGDSYAILGYYYNTASGCINRATNNFSIGHIGGLLIKNHGNGNAQFSVGDATPNPVCEGDPFTFDYNGSHPGDFGGHYGLRMWDNSSYTGSPIHSSSSSCGPCLPTSYNLPAGSYYATLTLFPGGSCPVLAPPLVIDVLPVPNGPTSASASPSIICPGDNSTLSGACPFGTVVWYTNSNATGSPVPGGSSPTVSPFFTTNYYAFCDDGTCLSTSNLSTTVTVIDPSITPTASASPTTGCSSYNTFLSGSCPSGGTLRWYSTSNGTGPGISSPYLVNTTQTIYARCFYSSAPSACQYSTSRSINLTVTPPPAAPTSASASPNPICVGNNSNLTATGCSGGTVLWYTNSSGSGAPLASTTVSPVVNTTYYAFCSVSGCRSTSNAAVTVVVTPIPNGPTSASGSPSSICTGGSSTLTATGCSGSVSWYTNNTGTGTPLTSNIVSPIATTTYYAFCTVNGCNSNTNASTTITVTSGVSAPSGLSGSPSNGCNSYTSNFSGNCAGAGQLRWYNTANGTGPSLSMPVTVNASNTTFYAKCFDASFPAGCQYSPVDSLTLNITTSVTVAISGPDTVCVNNTVNYISSHTPGSWFIASGSSSGSINSSGDFTSTSTPGTVVIGYSYPNGFCNDTGYLTVEVIPIPLVIFNDTSACLGNTIQLNPSIFGGVYVVISGPGSVTPGGLFSSSSTGITRVAYSININGCIGSDTANITIHPIPNQPTALATSNDTICVGSSTILTGTCTGSNIVWYNNNLGAGTPLFIGNNYSFSPNVTDTIYAFCYNSTTMCQSTLSDSLVIVVETCTDTIIKTMPSNGCGDTTVLPTANIPGGPNYISSCAGDSLTANGDTIRFINDSTFYLKPSSLPFLGDSACIIMCNTTIPFCDTTIMYWLPDTITPVPAPTITCWDDTVYLDSNGLAIIFPGQFYNITYGCLASDTTYLSQDTFACADTGVNPVWIYAQNNAGVVDSCLANITVLDTVSPTINCNNLLINIDGECEYTVPDFTDIVFDNCGDSLTITQTPLPGTILSAAIFGSLQFSQTVFITATDASNNQTICSFDINLNCNIELIIPQFISPNGDGLNDEWVIKFIEQYPNSSVKIFNRWGSIVYQMDNYDNSWDGKSNVGLTINKNKGIIPSSTYYYIVDKGDGSEAYTGYLYLRR